MKRSIFFKIFSGYFIIIFLLIGLILPFSFKTIKEHYIDTLTNDLKNITTTLKPKLTPLFENRRFEDLNEFSKNISGETKTRITVIDTFGKVVADSEEDPKDMENHKNRPEIIKALKGGFGKSLRYSTTVKEEMLYVAAPIVSNDKIIGVVRVSMFLREIESLLDKLKKRIMQIALIIIFGSLIGAIIISKKMSNPINKLVEASRQVASGNFSQRVLLKSKDELKELADNFNFMTEKINELFTDLTFKKDKLDGIISSIQEGLLVLDNKGKVILSNESFNKIIKDDHITDKFYWEILTLKSSELAELIKDTNDHKKNFTKDIPMNGKTFLCSATYLSPNGEIVLVLHDISEMKEVERIKKDFVDNVSHELRTPLTSIKGYLETLEEEIGEEQKEFLNIIVRNTDRLINIVKDLLFLSKLEDTNLKLEQEEVDVAGLVRNTLKIFEQKMQEKGLEIKLNVKGDSILIMADSFKLEQVFINLIDNAVKYTEKGEINIYIAKDDNIVNIQVKDTGIGIPEKHLSRIFERFYVVNKARSRKLGGTGLGLSIIKHIINLHNGEIYVESVPSKGTTFNITLPVDPSLIS